MGQKGKKKGSLDTRTRQQQKRYYLLMWEQNVWIDGTKKENYMQEDNILYI